MKKISAAISLLCNLAIIVMVTLSVVSYFSPDFKSDSVLEVKNTYCFRFFTTDSNVLCAVSCVFVAVYDVCALFGKKEIPQGVRIFKFVGTAAVAVTFFTVAFYLAPVVGAGMWFDGNCLYLHLICPVLAMVSFIFFERGRKIKWRYALLGAVPTVVYGIVYFLCVMIFKNWLDIYGFNNNGMWAYSSTLMIGGSVVVSYLILALNRLFCRKA